MADICVLVCMKCDINKSDCGVAQVGTVEVGSTMTSESTCIINVSALEDTSGARVELLTLV